MLTSVVLVPLKFIRWIITVVFEIMTFKLTSLQVFSRLMYFPGVGWNTIRWRLQKLQWYNRIDNTVVLGALPFRSQTKELIHKENIKAVISLNEDFELQWFTPSSKEWQKLGVDHYHFSVIDRIAPSLDVIDEALQVIHRHQLRKESVYVHCKSGKGRSVTIVGCYLMKENNWEPQRAIEEMKGSRPQIRPNRGHRNMLDLFFSKT